MDPGHVHCVLVATRAGEVVLERFFDPLSAVERSELRAALHEASAPVIASAPDEAEFVSCYRDASVVFSAMADCVLYLVGSGEYDELMLSNVTRVLREALKYVLKRPPSETAINEKYTKACLAIDEVLNEGMLDNTNPEAIKKALKLKVAD
eukprot:jgi/Tetstr1/431069/TSEL_020786.t1